ncbi:hypothetical protein EDD85DRAFT_953490 [Armillaria nabsnona]|nr:hypothetical protein EDD85DRAFT_953490 [Armillaria nabsnona]
MFSSFHCLLCQAPSKTAFPSPPTPPDFSVEEYEALTDTQTVVEDKYAEAVEKHGEWKAVKAREAHAKKLRLDKELRAAKLNALKQEAGRKAKEKRQEEEKKRLHLLKLKQEQEAVAKLKEQEKATEKKKKKKKKLREEQKKNEKTVKGFQGSGPLVIEGETQGKAEGDRFCGIYCGGKEE